ncbi:Crp/Fnr family transcriptional regulator [Edwardsiella ictaluri]|uniref:Cyclic nucleotide-binding domain protein n=1 Tax=Edwardsiella ictaluri (strain 93-146) TaxID=634503 RepID=C5BAX5_EDWI9|nr:Crp/Fnr family transcriptional regulator [Edwardsiella ictaluri]ACR70530.1 cyclic nucleotide-binding domain protein [Edwardsiella ictaluri 93-146]ARD39431.1 CarD family transcriptional regulator [Edwardsiella ictaluri]AVZ82648.1 Crp/Fnr family transcriptional regulator [Edwardsiella ictaluri]EKS7761637.1 Crp/Fnr family transcriptional regulator [Edwardsiella ictaluri]EKS7769414.1 Crp/Fnr family transcriptional regulator [Edwardsiella ictaluri]
MFKANCSMHGEAWQAIIAQVTANAALYDWVKHCPLSIMRRWSARTVAQNGLICRQGDICQHFRLILQGEADIFFEADDGRRYQQARYHQGDILGELEIFEQRPYICSVEATRETRLLELTRDDFHRWLALDNHFNQRILRTCSQQYYHLSAKAGADSLYTLQQRVSLALWHRFAQQESERIALDKPQLSHEFAAAVRSINRILFTLKAQHIIAVDGEYITLLDAERLRGEAGL